MPDTLSAITAVEKSHRHVFLCVGVEAKSGNSLTLPGAPATLAQRFMGTERIDLPVLHVASAPAERHPIRSPLVEHLERHREVLVDKYHRSAIPKLVLLFLPLKLLGALAWRLEVKKYRTIDENNAPLVRAMNFVPVLLGRTIAVAAPKPA